MARPVTTAGIALLLAATGEMAHITHETRLSTQMSPYAANRHGRTCISSVGHAYVSARPGRTWAGRQRFAAAWPAAAPRSSWPRRA